eukprot:204480-Prymnesium_polylepis.1
MTKWRGRMVRPRAQRAALNRGNRRNCRHRRHHRRRGPNDWRWYLSSRCAGHVRLVHTWRIHTTSKHRL